MAEYEEIKKRIIELLKEEKEEKREPKCLAIKGEWGTGKTYFWFEEIEKELSPKHIVYLSLFGKEHYTQILDEIVLNVCGKYNKTAKTLTNVATFVTKTLSSGTININPNTLFSFLKKTDFKEIVICFDDIERKSDNLSIKDFMGLVAELKERKQCDVVLLLNEAKMKGKDEASQNNRNTKSKNFSENEYRIFETYREKCIDYEFEIPNMGIAKSIIEKSLDFIDSQAVCKIYQKALEACFHFDPIKSNLRKLKATLKHLRYIYENCNFKHYKQEIQELDDKSKIQRMIDKFVKLLNNNEKDNLFGEYKSSHYLSEKEKYQIEEYLCEIIREKVLFDFHLINQEILKRNCESFADYIEKRVEQFQGKEYFSNFLSSTLLDSKAQKLCDLFTYYKEIRDQDFPQHNEIMKKWMELYIPKPMRSWDIFLERHHFTNEVKRWIEGYQGVYMEILDEAKKPRPFQERLKQMSDGKGIDPAVFEDFEIDEIKQAFRDDFGFYQKCFGYFSDGNRTKKQEKLFKALEEYIKENESGTKKDHLLKIIKR